MAQAKHLRLTSIREPDGWEPDDVFTSLAGPRVVAPPAASTNPGLQFGLWDYIGQAWQKWGIDAAP